MNSVTSIMRSPCDGHIQTSAVCTAGMQNAQGHAMGLQDKCCARKQVDDIEEAACT